jgi:hypothetical protein
MYVATRLFVPQRARELIVTLAHGILESSFLLTRLTGNQASRTGRGADTSAERGMPVPPCVPARPELHADHRRAATGGL